jgi:2-C-methyl-D-erythritol 2,4-cyclodiphosphate synthase
VNEYRSGMGIDVHQLSPGCDLVLGGVRIKHHSGLEGHSDGDVLIHSLIDAILGSLSLGDIGQHFPSSDESLKGISSIAMLKQINEVAESTDWQVSHVDATIIAQEPKLSDYINEMRNNIIKTLKLNIDQLNIKCTTTDYLGFIGAEKGIASVTIVTICRPI